MGTEILRYLSILSPLIPLVLFIRKKRLLKSNAIRFANLAIIVSILTDIVAAIFFEIKTPNSVVSNVGAIGFFLMIMLFYIKLMPEKIEWLYPFVVVYFGFLFVNTVLFQGMNEYQGYSRAFGGLVLIVCSLMYFNFLLTTLPAADISQYGPFWVNVGIVFYFSFNLLLFIFSDYVFDNMTLEIRKIFWAFHNVNNILKNVLFCMGFYYAGKN